MRNTKFEKLNMLVGFRGILMALAASLAMTACTVYDNYDIELMQDPTAIEESSSSEASSSSKEKDTSYVIVIGGSSSSEMERYSSSAWPCGDSTMSRGGVQYETVDINGLCITKQNVRYKPTSGKTLCYEDEDYPDADANCEKFGALYNFAAADKVCADGWRLLSQADVDMMINFAAQYGEIDLAGQHFKVAEEWTETEDALPGDNLIGFFALPGGLADEDGDFYQLHNVGQWWTSREQTKNLDHYVLTLSADHNGVSTMNIDNKEYASVRCVKE